MITLLGPGDTGCPNVPRIQQGVVLVAEDVARIFDHWERAGSARHPAGASRQTTSSTAQPKGKPVSTRRKIMVIDDNEDIRDAVTESLEDVGYGVWGAANGAIAIDALRESNDLPCLILLDLMMPVMDGAQFLQEMRKDPRLSALPVIVVTAGDSAIAKATDLGTHGRLLKPVQLNELLSTVSKYCQHHKGSIDDDE